MVEIVPFIKSRSMQECDHTHFMINHLDLILQVIKCGILQLLFLPDQASFEIFFRPTLPVFFPDNMGLSER
jgi:hypothetical protein